MPNTVVYSAPSIDGKFVPSAAGKYGAPAPPGAYSPEASWQTIISSFGYSMGFLFVILGRQQLFTENTLTPVLEVLRVKRMDTLIQTINLWLVVLVANILGTAIFGATLVYGHVLDDSIAPALSHIEASEYSATFLETMIRAVFAGWLVVGWLLVSQFGLETLLVTSQHSYQG